MDCRYAIKGHSQIYFEQLYDPTSPNYHHYLTPDQFTEQFGPTQQDYQAVIAFAQVNGLTITGTSPNNVILNVSGTVADLEKAFHLKMHLYKHPTESRTFFAPDVEPSVNLTVPILEISGLNNYSLPHSRLKTRSVGEAQRLSSNSGSGYGGSFRGTDFRAAYVPGVSLNGSGQMVGLLEFDDYDPTDITNYENIANLPLPRVVLENKYFNGFRGGRSGEQMEVCIDIEMAISMAPGLSKVIVYEGSPDSVDSPSAWQSVLNAMATDDSAKQLSCSWCIPGDSSDAVADGIFEQMAAQGQSFFNASGDHDAFTDSYWINPHGHQAQDGDDWPSGNPYITQVGGTTLTTSGPGGNWTSEIVWNTGYDSVGDQYWGSGGGISRYYTIPSWQQAISMYSNRGSSTMRNIPDVAMVANNVYVRCNNNDTVEVGTSIAAPLWAGFIALVNQQAAANGEASVGFINPAIYSLAQGSTYSTYFHDITSGTNEWPGSTNQFYAVSGYDLCTGLGTPTGQALIDDLAPIHIIVDQKLSTGTRVGTIGRWSGSSFPKRRLQPGGSILATSATEVLQGDQVIYNGQKYNNWTRNSVFDSTVLNHHVFSIRSADSNFTSNFVPTTTGITITDNLL